MNDPDQAGQSADGDRDLDKKLTACLDSIGAMGRVVVAFSAGVDSTLLLSLAVEALGAANPAERCHFCKHDLFGRLRLRDDGPAWRSHWIIKRGAVEERQMTSTHAGGKNQITSTKVQTRTKKINSKSQTRKGGFRLQVKAGVYDAPQWFVN